MSIVLYSNESGKIAQRLQKIIKGLRPEDRMEVFQNIDLLIERLRKPRGDMNIAVLLSTNRADLLEILSIKDLFEDIRTILILPDRDDETIARGHRLRPRFITFVDSDFKDVAAVLHKMLGNDYPTGNNRAHHKQ
jgi:hypothetical protein